MKMSALCAFFLLCAVALHAGDITVTYTGTILSSGVPFISLGDPFSGSFTFSYPSPILFDGSPLEINYSMSAATNNLLFSVDGYSFSAGPNPDLRITVWPQYPTGATFSDFFDVDQSVTTPDAVFSTNYPGYTLYSTSAQFYGDLNFLQSTALPSTFRAADVLPGDNGGYLTAASIVLQQDSTLYSVIGLIDTVQVTPEPASFLLLGIGLGALAMVRRRISTTAR